MPNQFDLFHYRRFWPLFVAQFLGAFNDNLMKTAVVVLVAYGVWDIGDLNPAVLVSLAAGVFIIPFVLLCPLAGAITDKYDKGDVIRALKKAEIVLVLLAVSALYWQSILFSFGILLALGAQSAFFAPAKYSLLPQHLYPDELIAGNGLVSTGTYVAILLGTILGALLALYSFGLPLICIVLLLSALAGYWASLYIPKAPSVEGDACLDFHLWRGAKQIFYFVRAQPAGVFFAVPGVSWFYFVAAMFHAQFPNYARQTLGVDHFTLAFFMVVFSAGIAAGGLLNNRILKSRMDLKFVPWALIGMSFFSMDLYLVSLPYAGHGDGSMVTVFLEFLRSADGFRIVLDLFLLSFFGGLYVVPLRSYVQYHTVPNQRARVVAGNSVVDAVFILFSALIAAVVLSLGFEVVDLFLMLSVACIPVIVFFFRTRQFSVGV